jgi:hypothetical protein
MKYLCSVDPGERKIGLAFFVDGVLTSAQALVLPRVELGGNQWLKTAEAIGDLLLPLPPGTLAIEEMKVRRGRMEAWDSLLEISRMTGALGDRAAMTGWMVRMVDPGRWTRKLEKAKHQERTKLSLTDSERDNILIPALEAAPVAEARSEIIDAVGIGLYILGRG